MNFLERTFALIFLFVVSVSSLTSATIQDDGINLNNYPNMFVLGDSLSDTGAFINYHGNWESSYVVQKDARNFCFENKNFLINSLDRRCVFRVNSWLPRIMNKPFYEYSFTNGPVAVQLVANRLGISNFGPGWEDRIKKNSRKGYNYATASAKILSSDYLLNRISEPWANLNAFALNSDRYTLTQQVLKLKKHHPVINPDDLIIVNIGSNDVIEIIQALRKVDPFDLITKFFLRDRLNKIIDSLFEQIEQLVNHRFRRIVIGNIPDLSLVPRFNNDTESQLIAKEIVTIYNQKFDDKFMTLKLNRKFSGKFRKFDINKIVTDLLKVYEKAGLVISKPAAEVDWTTNFYFNKSFSPYYINSADEENVNNYAFFDDIHPTGRMHQDIGEILYQLVNVRWPGRPRG